MSRNNVSYILNAGFSGSLLLLRKERDMFFRQICQKEKISLVQHVFIKTNVFCQIDLNNKVMKMRHKHVAYLDTDSFRQGTNCWQSSYK